MTQTEQHELEKLLADVAGIEYFLEKETIWWEYPPDDRAFGPIGGRCVWQPLTDANQMERVKAGLGLVGFSITRDSGGYSVKIWNEHPQKRPPNIWGARHPHKESLAFAIAVMAMKEGAVRHGDVSL